MLRSLEYAMTLAAPFTVVDAELVADVLRRGNSLDERKENVQRTYTKCFGSVSVPTTPGAYGARSTIALLAHA